MDEDALPLSLPQADIWHAQQLMPHTPFAIAYYVDISGEIDIEALLDSGSRAHHEFSSSTMRVTEADGKLMQSFTSRVHDGAAVIDLRDDDDALITARRWMDEDGRTAFPMEGQLVRLTLFRLADDHVLWYTRAHHIALDGYASMKVLERAAAIYSASRAGTEPEPFHPTPPAALVDEDERHRASARFERDRRFWESVSNEPLNSGPLTLGRVAPPQPASIIVSADTSRTGSPHPPSASERATSTVVIAAFAAFLARMTDSDDVQVSLPVSARPTALLRRAGSSMSNVVPLRLPGVGAATVDSVIKLTEVSVSAVLRHQRSRPTTSDNGSSGLRIGQFGPTVNVMMFANSIDVGELDSQVHILRTGPVADLAVNIYPTRTGSRSRIDFEANPAVYTPGEVSLHHRRFLHFLDRFTEPGCGDTAVKDLELFLPDEPRTTPASVGAPTERTASLIDVFDEAVRHHGDRIAVRDAGTAVTYAELSVHVDRLTDALFGRGIGPEDMVAVRASRSIAALAAFWAVARVGAVYVPIDPNLPRERAAFILGDCAAAVVLSPRAQVGSEPWAGEWLDIDGPAAPAGTAARASFAHSSHRAAYVIYTSGSTGMPKGVIVTHDGIGALTQHIRATYHLDSTSRICHLASPGFDTAVVEMLAAASIGASVVTAPTGIHGGAELTELLARESITHLLITPSALATLDPSGPRSVETIIIGGEAASQDIVDTWSPKYRLLNAYGPTETTCSVTMTSALHPREAAGIGAAMTGAVIHLLDHALNPVPTGGTGEIYIATLGIARGYLGRYAETAARFVANPYGESGSRLFRSGDRARLLADGNLEFLGRTDDQVKIRGNRVELGEIDAALRAHPLVSAASSTVRPTVGGGVRIDGYIVPTADGQNVDVRQIRRDIAQTLPAPMVPSTISVLGTIPLTVNRKLDRAALPEPTRPQASGEVAEPAGDTEVLIAAAYADILGVTDIDAGTTFFDLGGDSLAATRVVALIRVNAGVDVGVQDLTAAQSVRALAALVDARAHDDRSEQSRRPERGLSDGVAVIPLAPQQRHIDRSANRPLYNLPFTIDITGPFDADAATAALADLTARHRTLATVYPDSPSGPRQVVGPASPPGPAMLDAIAFDADAVDAVLAEPFDVRSENPIRVRLFVLGPDHHLLACAVHHIAADGWSLRLLALDFIRAYRARRAGTAEGWNELPLHYSDFSVWAARRSSDTDKSFWREELRGAPLDVGLPIDRPRPRTWDFTGARTSMELDSSAMAGLDRLARSSRTGRFTVLRSALLVLLARLTTGTDIVIGTPVAGRDDPLFDELVGMYSNTVAVRSDIASARTFEDVLHLAHTSELRALDHASAPFEEIVAELVDDPIAARHPIFQVALSLDVFASSLFVIDKTRFEITPRPLDIAKCDLHLHVTECRDASGDVTAIKVEIVYPTALFDEPTIAEFGRAYEQILRDIVTDPTSNWMAQSD